jgi:hypothetical protein
MLAFHQEADDRQLWQTIEGAESLLYSNRQGSYSSFLSNILQKLVIFFVGGRNPTSSRT